MTIPAKPAGGGIGGFDDNDHGDVPFAVGSLFGVRCWEIVESGKSLVLKGQHGGVWADGENVAVCPAGHEQPPWKKPSRGAPGCDCPPVLNDAQRMSGRHDWECRLGKTHCGCGFWGYWTLGAAPNFNPARCVVGVIEGYGRILRGPSGFRCAKARIVGIHLAMRVIDDHGYDHPDTEMVLTRFEMALAETYPSVPAYATAAGLLAMHPPTLDYLPEGQRPEPYKRPEPVPPRPSRNARLGVTEAVVRTMRSGDAVDVPLGSPPAGWPGRIIR